MPSLSNKQLADLRVEIPPVFEQQCIVAGIDALADETRQLEHLYQGKVQLVAELKKSLLHKAFTGELTADPSAADRTLSEAGL